MKWTSWIVIPSRNVPAKREQSLDTTAFRPVVNFTETEKGMSIVFLRYFSPFLLLSKYHKTQQEKKRKLARINLYCPLKTFIVFYLKKDNRKTFLPTNSLVTWWLQNLELELCPNPTTERALTTPMPWCLHGIQETCGLNCSKYFIREWKMHPLSFSFIPVPFNPKINESAVFNFVNKP